MKIWTCPNCVREIDLTGRLLPLVCECGGVLRTNGKFFVPQPKVGISRNIDSEGKWIPISKDLIDEMTRKKLDAIQAQGNRAWTALHSYHGCDPAFLDDWEQTIPNASCACAESYRRYKMNDAPDFSSPVAFFEWGVRIHNEVNKKLGKKQCSIPHAIQLWKRVQQQTDKLNIVTSLSLLPKHKEVQEECLDSWRRLGVRIISGNTEKEIDRLQSLYNVQYAVVRPSTSYDRPTPRIFDLLHLCKDKPTLLINSDIAIHGWQHVLIDAVDTRTTLIGVRHNHTGTIAKTTVEQWGIDAFLLYPEQVSTFPDLDFAIGQTLWDYWVPYHLERSHQKMRWIGEPYFFHQSHRVHWLKQSFLIGRKMMAEHYGDEVDWERWRRERPYAKQVAKG